MRSSHGSGEPLDDAEMPRSVVSNGVLTEAVLKPDALASAGSGRVLAGALPSVVDTADGTEEEATSGRAVALTPVLSREPFEATGHRAVALSPALSREPLEACDSVACDAAAAAGRVRLSAALVPVDVTATAAPPAARDACRRGDAHLVVSNALLGVPAAVPAPLVVSLEALVAPAPLGMVSDEVLASPGVGDPCRPAVGCPDPDISLRGRDKGAAPLSVASSTDALLWLCSCDSAPSAPAHCPPALVHGKDGENTSPSVPFRALAP
jgi:hypothetical protein